MFHNFNLVALVGFEPTTLSGTVSKTAVYTVPPQSHYLYAHRDSNSDPFGQNFKSCVSTTSTMNAFVKYVISVIKPYIVYNDVHFIHCGAIRIRTENILLAKQILYQLSYSPSVIVPREGIEPSHLVCKTNTLPLHQQGWSRSFLNGCHGPIFASRYLALCSHLESNQVS